MTDIDRDELRKLLDEVVAAREEEGVTEQSDRNTWSLMTARTSRAEGKVADALPRLLDALDAKDERIRQLEAELAALRENDTYEGEW